jgi:hypothetical protein
VNQYDGPDERRCRRTLADSSLVTHTDEVTTTSAPDLVAKSRVVRGAWFCIGGLSVALGGVGVIVPGLPTTIFMIIAVGVPTARTATPAFPGDLA